MKEFVLLFFGVCFFYQEINVLAQTCPVPCHRNATCIKSNDASQCLCNIGFTGNGMQCTSITACSNDNQCHANATCVDATGSAQCRCKPGFVGNGLQCTDADECASNTHKCHVNAECVNTVGSYQCRCRTGWQGNGTFCQDIDECLNTGTNDCNRTLGICTNTPGSYKCSCRNGYTGDGKSCVDVNECADVRLNNCEQRCINSEGSYTCGCFLSFFLNADARTCTAFGGCVIPTCSANGKCGFFQGRPLCFCSLGYQPQASNTTCADIDECSRTTTNQCQQVCNNTAGSYSCGCNDGYRLNSDNTTCTDIDECKITPSVCSSNANCSNTLGSYQCTCRNGFTGNGKNCTNIDECSTMNPCSENATCIDTFGSYKCQCKSGYTGDGMQCMDIDECIAEIPCGSNEICTNNAGSYNCSCITGYARNSSSICVDIDECSNQMHNCHNDSNCINIDRSFYCVCKEGFTGNGTHCYDINECMQNVSCTAQSTCINTYGSYRCDCDPGFERNGTQCVNTDECLHGHNCHSNATCIDTFGSYNCSCKTGFSGNGRFCDDIDECLLDSSCRSFETCSNSLGSYKCTDYCPGKSCPDLAVCRSIVGQHICRCRNGHILNQNKCIRAMRIFAVDNLVLTRQFMPSFADSTSSSFTTLAHEVESVLTPIFMASTTSKGFGAIQVTKLQRGSVVVSFYVLYVNHTTATMKQVETVLRNKTKFSSLNPDPAMSPRIAVSNLCEVGGHDCREHSFCVPTDENRNFKCDCVDGFEMRDGKCKRKRTYIEIIIPAVIGGLILLFFICLLIMLIKKRRRVKKTHEIHIEHISNGHGIENNGLELNDVKGGKQKQMDKR